MAGRLSLYFLGFFLFQFLLFYLLCYHSCVFVPFCQNVWRFTIAAAVVLEEDGWEAEEAKLGHRRKIPWVTDTKYNHNSQEIHMPLTQNTAITQ